jgi:asparagine synthase (glutamine-hydrolysing)
MNSLEARSPFLDIDLVNRARTIPSALKLRGGVTKYILKKALEPILPMNILHRKKQGFSLPIAEWFKSRALEVNDALHVLRVNHTFTRGMKREHECQSRNNSMYLWNYKVLNKFCMSLNLDLNEN